MARRRPSGHASVYEHLDPAERARVIAMLLDERPELRADAERTGAELLADVSADEVADEIAARLGNLALEALASRAGRQPGRGYVHESEAAYELVEEAMAPLVEDVRRRASLGMHDAAAQLTLGGVTGMYRCRDAPDGSVLAYAGEVVPSELARWIAGEATKAGIELRPSDLAAACPDWAPLRL
jgi:hypothetical protein